MKLELRPEIIEKINETLYEFLYSDAPLYLGIPREEVPKQKILKFLLYYLFRNSFSDEILQSYIDKETTKNYYHMLTTFTGLSKNEIDSLKETPFIRSEIFYDTPF